MPMIALMYHDVIDGDDWDASGFPGPGAAIYKLARTGFEAHLDAIRSSAGAANIVGESGPDRNGHTRGVALTFDDGGVSAATVIAPALERLGWRGHFFITTERIGHPGFVSAALIRELAARGHIIGAHSHTHPTRMSACGTDQLLSEWRTSTCILGEILGEPVTVASVPGGYYSREVARTAAACGIQTLFTSEPTARVHLVERCRVIGRYTLRRDDPPAEAAALASGRGAARHKQAAAWNAKKIAKALGGASYLKLRERLLRRQ